jgi:hypothetical protein
MDGWMDGWRTIGWAQRGRRGNPIENEVTSLTGKTRGHERTISVLIQRPKHWRARSLVTRTLPRPVERVKIIRICVVYFFINPQPCRLLANCSQNPLFSHVSCYRRSHCKPLSSTSRPRADFCCLGWRRSRRPCRCHSSGPERRARAHNRQTHAAHLGPAWRWNSGNVYRVRLVSFLIL